MALPTIVGVGSLDATTTSVTPGLPTGWQPDDIHLLLVESDQVTAAAPAGWAHVTGSPVTGAFARLNVFWRRAQSGDTAPTVADPGSDHLVGIIIGIRGCVTTGNPWDQITAGTSSGSGTVTMTGFTTTVNDCLILMLASHGLDTSTPQFSGWANGSLASVAEIAGSDVASSVGNGGGVGAGKGEKATAGVVSNSTVTFAGGSSGNKNWIHLALKPAVAAGIRPGAFSAGWM